jgi:hypothetical protein
LLPSSIANPAFCSIILIHTCSSSVYMFYICSYFGSCCILMYLQTLL